jgi:hypothetical protein
MRTCHIQEVQLQLYLTVSVHPGHYRQYACTAVSIWFSVLYSSGNEYIILFLIITVLFYINKTWWNEIIRSQQKHTFIHQVNFYKGVIYFHLLFRYSCGFFYNQYSPPVTDNHYHKKVVWSTDRYGWESNLHILIVIVSDYIGRDNDIYHTIIPTSRPNFAIIIY